MKKMMPFINSLRFKLLVSLFFIGIPLIVVLFLSNFYAVQVVQKQAAQYNKNTLNLHLRQIDGNLSEVDNFLFDLSEVNLDVAGMEIDETKDFDEYTKAKIRVFQYLNIQRSYYNSIDLFFVYSVVNRELIMTSRSEVSYEEKGQEFEMILNLLQTQSDQYNNLKWYVYKAFNHYYLFHLVKTGDIYVGAWVKADKLMVPLEFIDMGGGGAALLVTDKLEPMNHVEAVRKQQIRLQYQPDLYYKSGSNNEYLVMGEHSTKGNFSMVTYIPDKTILEKLPYINKIIIWVSVGAILFMLLFLYWMRSAFLIPINRIVSAMRKIQNGHWTSRIPEVRTSTEFELMNNSFNQMIRETEELKIHVYEEKINVQKAELKHLQLQINPHFFLNSLNIIYNLASVKKYAIIQDMSKSLIQYFRYMQRSGSDLVYLQDELKHTSNYLRISSVA